MALQGEHPVEPGEVQLAARGEHALRLTQQIADLFADRRRVRRRGHRPPGAHQDVVAGQPPQPAEAATDRGGGEPQPLGRAGDAALFEQRVQDREQVQIQLHDGKS